MNLPDEDIIRILHSISCGKYRILAKEPNNKTINKADIFTFNAAFTDRMRRIKVRAVVSCCSCFSPILVFYSRSLHHPG